MNSDRLTLLLSELSNGKASVTSELLPLVYDELRGLARNVLQSNAPSHTLQPTALVNEVCVRLLSKASVPWESRTHFFAVAATAMRQVLSNHARAKRAEKRSPSGQRVTVSGVPTEEAEVDLLGLDDALTKLSSVDPRQAQLVELRFFGGMTMPEAAGFLGISVPTAEREWRAARAFLRSELEATTNS